MSFERILDPNSDIENGHKLYYYVLRDDRIVTEWKIVPDWQWEALTHCGFPTLDKYGWVKHWKVYRNGEHTGTYHYLADAKRNILAENNWITED